MRRPRRGEVARVEIGRDCRFETAAEELDYPAGIELKQDGYLVLAHSEQAFATLESCLSIHHELGVPSELLDADECVRMVPPLGRNRLVGGSFCGKDGSISPETSRPQDFPVAVAASEPSAASRD